MVLRRGTSGGGFLSARYPCNPNPVTGITLDPSPKPETPGGYLGQTGPQNGSECSVRGLALGSEGSGCRGWG